jgi:adenosylmethionine-8-amino-7-oxononanoate aminotransferase
MAEALMEQMGRVAYVYRLDFTTPVLEEAAAKVSEATNGWMDKVFFVSGGSEATESAVKLARKYHMERGEPGRYKVISRWLSYHGMTMGALAWSGMPGRRAEFGPYLLETGHIAPAYCYRCWFDREPGRCGLECAHALEREILLQGPQSVAAFIAEPVSGMGLCAAHPPDEYWGIIRDICDRYGVLLILDEVMTGFGRTGKWFAYMHSGVKPDILALGKGLGGGYFPLGAAAVTAEIADAIAKGSGSFTAGHTWAANPMGAAVVSRTIDVLRRDQLVERAAELGLYLGQKLGTLADHPLVGDIRGRGLMWGVELVGDKKTKEPCDPGKKLYQHLAAECIRQGLYLLTSGGCDQGRAGDILMLAPAFIAAREHIDEIVGILGRVLNTLAER